MQNLEWNVLKWAGRSKQSQGRIKTKFGNSQLIINVSETNFYFSQIRISAILYTALGFHEP